MLRQVNGESVPQPMTSATLATLCGGGGPGACPTLLAQAVQAAFTTLSNDNGSTTPSTWTANSETVAGGAPIPALDAIHFAAAGLAGQPNIDWQNRPTFQQVVEFASSPPLNVPESPAPLLLLLMPAGMVARSVRRRRSI